MNYPKRTDILLGAATLTLTALFFIPFSLYLLNKEVFFSAPSLVAMLLLAFAAIAFTLLSLPLLFTRGMARAAVLTMLMFLTLAIWTQANFLNWDYGLLDGSALRWRLFERHSIIDISVWLFLFISIMTIGIMKKISFRTLFLILLFMQSGNILYTWTTVNQDISHDTTENLSITTTDRFSFSTEKNIILLVLDAYQTDIFNEYLEHNPDFKKKLPGFTYYPNAVSEHFYTERSIPTLLTGNYLTANTVPENKTFKEHKNDMLRHHSIPALLKDSNYHVGIYPFYAKNNYPPAIFGGSADNYLHTNLLLEEGANEISGLMAVCMFRIAPHLFKKKIHTRFLLSASFEQDRDEFTFDMQKHLRAGITAPCFKYYHLQGLHGPHIINGERMDAEDRKSALKIAHLVNRMLAEFIAKLQEVHVYNNADIFIVADHGLYNDSEHVRYGNYSPDLSEDNMPPLDAFVKKCRALPLFLYKPARATAPLNISCIPVCLSDIFPTLLDIAAIDAPAALPGISVKELQENTPRIRHHFNADVYRQRSVVPDYEFIISGFSWHDSSWIYTGNCFSDKNIHRIPLNNYKLGTALTFGISGNGREYLDENWNSDDNCHRTTKAGASLSLPIANPAPLMRIELEIAPYNNTGDIEKEVAVSVFINTINKETFYIR
ncbi:MAG: sulfatase-like hydrolase/transferase, partial [Candidatus Hydrogenedentes bacterium]|nr:sulfatase-like hydrolase/transferase [Candidatus Hydrogenedentota bacterium]